MELTGQDEHHVGNRMAGIHRVGDNPPVAGTQLAGSLVVEDSPAEDIGRVEEDTVLEDIRSPEHHDHDEDVKTAPYQTSHHPCHPPCLFS